MQPNMEEKHSMEESRLTIDTSVLTDNTGKNQSEYSVTDQYGIPIFTDRYEQQTTERTIADSEQYVSIQRQIFADTPKDDTTEGALEQYLFLRTSRTNELFLSAEAPNTGVIPFILLTSAVIAVFAVIIGKTIIRKPVKGKQG